ncbi:Conserved oligomeric Golgi complex subunit 5 [Rhizoctonia solani]|uniref:Conserved oligomeric Golgi complex subunit 5 n=1 Tax=Rhizoctonia solani TaxID=456999 RepID=A0A0K6FNL6_9AGAM|nr:Conserved oligomeric Golgi complex subunit 5 [Rhizoctonia solani]
MMSDWAEREFGSDAFDPTEYTHKALAAPASGNAASEDITQLIGRLTLAVDDVAGQIRSLVVAHHEALLAQAANVSGMEGLLSSVRVGINELTQSLDRLRLKVHVPYQTLAGLFSQLQKLRQAADVLRRTSRFVALARRLELQMKEIDSGVPASTLSKSLPTGDSRGSLDSAAPGAGAGTEDGNAKERAVARAALSAAELASLLETPATNTISDEEQPAFIPLQKINVITRLVPTLEASRKRINEEMESMIIEGLASLNQSVLAAALQTAFNLRIMPTVVQSLLLDLTEAVDARIKSAFDVSKIAKEISGNDPAPQPTGLMYRSRLRTAPTNLTAPQWTNALWARLEQMIEEMAGCCIKVYNLEKVLKYKKDPTSQASFLDEAMAVLENKPATAFWSALARSLDKHSKEAAKGSTFLQQTLSTGYPRFLRLFHDLFAKIAVHTDTIYTSNQQSPETVIVLRSVSAFEQLYLSRSTARMNETIATAVRQSPPGAPEGLAISRTIVNELDSARFDPLLVKSVAKNVGAALDMLVGRTDSLIVRDRSATSLVGPLGTAQQALNAQIFTMLHTCWARLNKLEGEFHEGVTLLLKPPIKKIEVQCEGISGPLLTAIRRDLGLVLARMHRVDFSKSFEAMAPGMGGGASTYMKELTAKLGFLRNEVFSKFSVNEVVQDWTINVAKNVIRTFVLNASIIKPLGEAGKLQLTSDMTELEFTLGSFVADPSRRTGSLDILGDDYRVLRALRPLLFLDTALLSSPDDTYSLPPLIILHHIIVRSPYPLPHTLHSWTEAEYVRWIEDHAPREALALVEACVPKWETQTVEIKGTEEDWVTLVRSVLRRAVSA